ncbi:MAG: lamin tail domain-containing protein [Polyangiaceae bacterium]
MNRPLLLAKIALAAAACATVVACSQSAASKKSGDGDDTGDDFGGDSTGLPPARTPDQSNDESGAFSPGGRKSSGGTPDGGRAVPTDDDAGSTALSLCADGIQPGDVKIVEFMISSVAGSGDKGEWVELQSTRTDCILDVSNLTISSPRGTGSDTVTINDGLQLNPGDTFLVADSSDTTVNNALTMPLYAWGSFDVLKNDGDEIDVTLSGTTIDSLTYPSFGNLETGNSVSFPSDCQWSDRSDWSRWSYSFDTYSGVLAGTPNAPNDDVTCF